MHNRDMIWTTSEGKRCRICDLSSTHLVNIINHIEKNKNNFLIMFGDQTLKYYLFNIRQEIRLRKLNTIESSKDEENLF